MDPSPPHGVPDLCPECGAYWHCEHKPEPAPDDGLWHAQYEPMVSLQDQLASAWHSFSVGLAAALPAIEKAVQSVAEAMAEFVDLDEKDPDWPEWAHADWLPFPHRFRPVGAVDAAISAAAAALDWQAERPRGPPHPRLEALNL